MGKKGYTLIELVVVIALLGIMLVIGIPRLRHLLVADDLNATARRIVALVKEIRNTAAQEYKDFTFYFDLNSQKIWYGPTLKDNGREITMANNSFQLSDKVRILDVQTPSKGKQTTGTVYITFSRKGYIEQTMVHLVGSGGKRKTLELTPFLGVIRVHDTYVDFTGQ